MLMEELFYKVIARSHATQSEQPEEGEMILRRLSDFEDRSQSQNNPAAVREKAGFKTSHPQDSH